MEDNEGRTHDMLIANTIDAPKAHFLLLMLQHWRQQSADLHGT